MLAVALTATTAAGQPPAVPTDLTDALITKALANDPDVQVARAKLTLAEAEVAKARQAAVGRVLALRDTVEQQQQSVKSLEEETSLALAAAKSGAVGRDVVIQYQGKLASARAALARSETELRLRIGDGPKVMADQNPETALLNKLLGAEGGPATDAGRDKVLRAYAGLLDQARAAEGIKSLAGPIPARLGAALEKRVSLGTKGQKVTFAEAIDVFKAKAGFDIPVRPMPQPMPEIVSDGVELPVIAWLQMFQDLGGRQGEGFAFYVREYGLLVANRQTAPPDAVSLTAFWRAHAQAEAAPPTRQPAEKRPGVPQDKLPAVLKAKAGESIVITFPVKTADVEDAKVFSDAPPVVGRVESSNGMLVVVIRAERAGKARVAWDITDATGRRFTQPGREVEFE